MKPPAFQFYADDFIAGVADMTQAEVGAYIMLLAHGWNTQGLKASDPARLKLLAKGDVSDHVLGKFTLENGKLYNKRQEHERQKQEVYRRKQALNGAKGGRPKKEAKPNPSLSSGLSQTEPKKSFPSPSPSPLVERESFPEIPPMSRKDFDAMAAMRAVPAECAEWFWNVCDSRNWTDATGQPIRKVEPLLLNAWVKWRQATAKRNGSPAPSMPQKTLMLKILEAI